MVTQSSMPDQVAIWQLLCRYCHLIDRGEMIDVVNLFHSEATLIFPPNPPARGRRAILNAYNDWLRTAREPTVWLRHQVNTPSISIAGDRASAMSYFIADFLLRKNGRIQALLGRYEDELLRKDDKWLLYRREIVVNARLDLGEPRREEIAFQSSPR